MNKNVKGTVNMIVSNTSSLKSPSGSSSSSASFLSTTGIWTSGSEVCGRLRSEGCRRGISVYFISSYTSSSAMSILTADVYVPVVDSGSSSTVTLAIVLVLWYTVDVVCSWERESGGVSA
jgi:hypothetical protein